MLPPLPSPCQALASTFIQPSILSIFYSLLIRPFRMSRASPRNPDALSYFASTILYTSERGDFMPLLDSVCFQYPPYACSCPRQVSVSYVFHSLLIQTEPKWNLSHQNVPCRWASMLNLTLPDMHSRYPFLEGLICASIRVCFVHIYILPEPMAVSAFNHPSFPFYSFLMQTESWWDLSHCHVPSR